MRKAGAFRCRSLAAIAVALVVLGAGHDAAVAGHDCGSQQPRCVDYGYMYKQKQAQYVMSRTLAHHCEDGKETIRSRIEVVFGDVTQHSAHLQKITIYFDGEHTYHLGALDAYGPKNEFHYQDHNTDYPPGSTLSLYPDKKVDLGDGAFVVEHKPWRGMIGGTPGPRGGSVIIPCQGHPHQFLIRVRERPQRDPCREVRPPGPC